MKIDVLKTKIDSAIITSTINPPKNNWYGALECYQLDSQTRLEQTLQTIESLKAARIKNIVVADNSLFLDSKQLIAIKITKCEIFNFPADNPHTLNKGILELQLLEKTLACKKLPGSILKISGRYKIENSSPLFETIDADIAGLYKKVRKNIFLLSTRAFLVRDEKTFKRIIFEVHREVWRAKYQIGSLHLLNRCITNFLIDLLTILKRQPLDSKISIEEAYGRLISKDRISCLKIEKLVISGTLAATGQHIDE